MQERARSPWGEGWDGDVASRWLAFEADHDRILEAFGQPALTTARPAPGERVIDVGCGCGATSLALGEAVGPGGHVLGIDVSAPLLTRARQRAAALSHIEFVQDDAQTAQLPRNRDLVFSRFGMMFFRDPPIALQNLAGALRPGGRLVFVCWRRFEDNPWLHLPFSAARELLPRAPSPPEKGPSPFSLGDKSEVAALLKGAGFDSISVERIDQRIVLGSDLPAAADFAMHTGPTGRGLPGTDEATRAEAHRRIAAALSAHVHPEGISLAASAWLVMASRGAGL
jgi:SAM-dependent methyltransferase